MSHDTVTKLPAVPETQTNEGLRDLAHRLKMAIDQEGLYSKSLNDMAAGYAAGTGAKPFTARQEIAEEFKKQFKATPHEYLSQCRAEMPNKSSKRTARSAPVAELAVGR